MKPLPRQKWSDGCNHAGQRRVQVLVQVAARAQIFHSGGEVVRFVDGVIENQPRRSDPDRTGQNQHQRDRGGPTGGIHVPSDYNKRSNGGAGGGLQAGSERTAATRTGTGAPSSRPKVPGSGAAAAAGVAKNPRCKTVVASTDRKSTRLNSSHR